MRDQPADVEPAGENVAGETPAAEPEAVTDETTVHDDDVELERTIGLGGGLAIGVGTMIGAGIFVFPGLAASNAGLAATLSFAVGGLIALLVALPTSELATAMPRSGGGYYFISRGMGTAYGAIVGLGLWLGLMFASAFYLVGLGHYASAVFAELAVSLPFSPVIGIGLLFGAALTALSIGGTENTAKIQNAVVGVLLVVLTGFLSYGILDAIGVFGGSSVPGQFFSRGFFPVLATAALVFTSYLGFAQVATVAGVFGAMGVSVTLYHVAASGETDEDAETLFNGLVGRLEDAGMDPSLIETHVDRDQEPIDAIIEAAAAFDAVVMGESDPSLTTFVFGVPTDQLADRFLGPVFIVQRNPASDEDAA